jgi:ribosomal protein S6--L-glutamate ligase
MLSNPVSESERLAAVEGMPFPLVVKPNSATRGVGVAKVDDPDSLVGVTEYLDLVHDYRATGDKSYLVQEFLPDARDYRAMVVDGDCYGGVERRLPREARERGRWKHNVHRGAEAERVDLPAELRGLAEETAAALGVDYLGVDLLVTDDRVVVGETNARPTVDTADKYDEGFYDALAGVIRRRAGEK